MDENLGAQYAMQIAVQTLRERCKSLQIRVSTLEEENMNLRVQCNPYQPENKSLTEIDKLRERVTQLTEQKEQLQNKVRMICNENQDLWNKLGKLTSVNKNLGDQLNKINDTVSQVTGPLQPHSPLIRSKTFTQYEPQSRFLQKNLEINEKISLELEDISLKLTESFSKQKMELDELCAELDFTNIDKNVTENCGFFYDEELDEDIVRDVKNILENFKMLQTVAVRQKSIIEENIVNVNSVKENLICKTCEMKTRGMCDRTTSIGDLPKMGVDKFTEMANFQNEKILESAENVEFSEKEKVCPVCAKYFHKDLPFCDFQQHVEDHFTGESYEIL